MYLRKCTFKSFNNIVCSQNTVKLKVEPLSEYIHYEYKWTIEINETSTKCHLNFLRSNESNCSSVTSSDSSKCPQEDWTVQAIAAIYMLFSNFLLVNLVIAMFRFGIYRAILIHFCSYNAYIMLYFVKCFIYGKSSVNRIFFYKYGMAEIEFRV